MRDILVIDDERGFGEMLRTMLTKDGYRVTYLAAAKAALEQLGQGTAYDVILCDVQMPGLSGVDFLRELGVRGLTATVVMMSAYGTIDTAVECMKLGALDYISKPFKADELFLKLRRVEERLGLERENAQLKKEVASGLGFDEILGRSEPMRKLFDTISKIADYKSTVLLTGESGTGKELVARAVHNHSRRATRPFVAVNCGAIPEQLLESELFGYVKGAFTDASRDKRGMFEEATGGTLFLDEIGELPLPLQVKLLRAIQEEEIRRVGDTQSTKVDVRIVAATVRNLRAEVDDRRFREDLFYRLNVLPIHLPPLRDRSEDIPLLADAFVKKASKRLGKLVTSIEAEAMRLLVAHSWPGNVRELENTIERACVFADADVVTPSVLPDHLQVSTPRVKLSLGADELSIKKATRLIEEDFIRRALSRTNGNRTNAAKVLEISHRALLYKIKEFDIDIPPR